MQNIKLLDVVALLEDLPPKGLHRGQVGTVVESLAPGVFEVEFSDSNGKTYASLALRSDQLLVLHHLLILALSDFGRAFALPAGAAASTPFESGLRKLDETELAGIRKREVKFVDTVYAPDVVMFPVYGPFKVEGLDRVREAWRSLYDTFAAITRCEWSERRYVASGAASAWMTCLWSLEGSNSDGQPLEMVLR